jgi:hypothetical protein
LQIKIISENPDCGFCITLHNPFPMPRPKTEMTKSGKTIAVRATLSEWNEFKRLGGTKWLRQLLADSIEKQKKTV